ncbi:hypothetical protein HJFPF1_08472 [Paramyrothecium foliicola]|nr:hypothetical protein HJFPF1_08472 [Paramyrothecium foliicola]
MALCGLCRDIPFGSLPTPPEYNASHHVVDDRNLIEFITGRSAEDRVPDEALGFNWHENIKALAESAKSLCPLCVIVQNAVESWVERYETARSTSNFYREFGKDYEVDLEKERLRLTKRVGGGNGLTVFVRNARTHKSIKAYGVIALGSVAFTAEGSSSLATELPLRPLSADSGSSESLAIVTNWLEDCASNHAECLDGDTALPTRLLDVGSASDEVVKLVEPGADRKGKYASLSYCWGTSETLTTTRNSLNAHISGIRLLDLPKTFQDAVAITRHLGLRYIWIDSLCIFQDDRDDWARESARMFDVYSNAFVVIAANRASASEQGCFHERPPRVSSEIDIPGVGPVVAQLVSCSDEFHQDQFEFETEPLTQRAWALQERLLARRILHYNSRQVYFECNHGVVSEDGCRSDERYCSLEKIRQSMATTAKIRATWNSVLWAYGRRNLTIATDKLPALSGIARLIGSALDDQYIAGLWAGALVEGLAWQGLGGRRPQSVTEYTGPTWSWPSYQGIAATGLQEGWRTIASIESWHVDLRNENDPYGHIKNAWIKVRAPLLQLEPSKVPTTEHETRLKKAGMTPHPRLLTKFTSDEEGNMLTMDYEDNKKSGNWREWNIKVMILGGYLKSSEVAKPVDEPQEKGAGTDETEEELRVAFGLALVPADEGDSSKMRRIGWMFLDGTEVDKCEHDEDEWDTVTIV